MVQAHVDEEHQEYTIRGHKYFAIDNTKSNLSNITDRGFLIPW